MFKVTYTIKDKNGYLVDKTKNFELLQNSFKFIRELNNDTKVVGKPVIERK